MRLVAQQRTVEQSVATGLNPPFDQGVHPGHLGILDAAEHDLDAGVGEDGVEQRRVPAVSIADEEAGPAAGVLQVHGEVTHGLGNPRGGRVRGGAQDPYPPGGMLDDGQDLHPGTGQGHGFEEVSREDSLGLRA
jgi:hypothetical protein